MTYFNTDFPQILYGFAINQSDAMPATNILRRFKPLQEVLQRVDIYYPYDVKSWERPEVVSHKIYGTVEYDWILMMFNLRFDRYFEWPMNPEELNNLCAIKYGSWENATQTINHYEMITVPYQRLNDGTVIQQQTLWIDETAYNAQLMIDSELVFSVTNYDYEKDLNERHRHILVVDSVFIPQILSEKAKIFNG